jgi:hypothetical protein
MEVQYVISGHATVRDFEGKVIRAAGAKPE